MMRLDFDVVELIILLCTLFRSLLLSFSSFPLHFSLLFFFVACIFGRPASFLGSQLLRHAEPLTIIIWS